jgi:hypothetical protein
MAVNSVSFYLTFSSLSVPERSKEKMVTLGYVYLITNIE